MNNANWWKELKAIDKKEKILAIAVEPKDKWDKKEQEMIYYEKKDTELFRNFKDAKKLLNFDFDDGFGGEEGVSFTAWTKSRVYFPACYDGSEWIASVPRKICKEATEHI